MAGQPPGPLAADTRLVLSHPISPGVSMTMGRLVLALGLFPTWTLYDWTGFILNRHPSGWNLS